MKVCYTGRFIVVLIMFFCTTMPAADDEQCSALAIAQWQAAEKNEQLAPLAQEALISRWDTLYHGNLKFLSNGNIALATTMPPEHIAVYEQDGKEVRVYVDLRSAWVALSRGEKWFDNGCVARGCGPNENGEKSSVVEIVSPDGEKLAEYNYGPECISNLWLEHTAICPNGRYLVSRRLGPMRVHAVIKDLKTGAEKLLGQVGMPDFSPDGRHVAFCVDKTVFIYSCEALFADVDMAEATE